MKEIREMIKTGELNRLEKFVLKDNLKIERGKYKSRRTTRKKEITKEGRSIRKYRTKLSKQMDKNDVLAIAESTNDYIDGGDVSEGYKVLIDAIAGIA